MVDEIKVREHKSFVIPILLAAIGGTALGLLSNSVLPSIPLAVFIIVTGIITVVSFIMIVINILSFSRWFFLSLKIATHFPSTEDEIGALFCALDNHNITTGKFESEIKRIDSRYDTSRYK